MSVADPIAISDIEGVETKKKNQVVRRAHKVPVPRFYVVATKALSARLDGQEQHNSFIFRQDKVRNIGRLKRLVLKAQLNFKALIETLEKRGFSFQNCEKRLAAVIAADVAFSEAKYLPKSSNNKVKEVVKHKEALQALSDAHHINSSTQVIPLRYAILNRLKTNRSTLENMLLKLGYMKTKFERKPEQDPDSLEDYWNFLRNLEISEYTWDIHFPDEVLVFHIKSQIQTKKLAKDWKILLLFNKSVLAPVRALGARFGDRVLDSCAAPGNKSVLVANTCKTLVCCERSGKRYAIMLENLKHSGVMDKCNCETIHSDFLKLGNEDTRLKECTMALVDPSCSGGGDVDHILDETRVEKLANLQAVCLKKVLALPSMKTVVYSTCSRAPKENEGVVKEILVWAKTQSKKIGLWVLEEALPDLPFRGNEAEFPNIGNRCLFFDEERSQTSVQFIAKFVRKFTGDAKLALMENLELRIKLKRLRKRKRRYERARLNKKV